MTKLESLVSLFGGVLFAYERPNNYKNCVVYKQISSNPIRTHNSTVFEKTRIQIDCWGESMNISRNLADQIKDVLDLNKTNFNLAYLINDFTVKDLETGLFNTILDFYIL